MVMDYNGEVGEIDIHSCLNCGYQFASGCCKCGYMLTVESHLEVAKQRNQYKAERDALREALRRILNTSLNTYPFWNALTAAKEVLEQEEEEQ